MILTKLYQHIKYYDQYLKHHLIIYFIIDLNYSNSIFFSNYYFYLTNSMQIIINYFNFVIKLIIN
jgi:hypothetical protein